METLFIAGGWKRILFSFFLFFCLDAKEPKDQDTAKLPPHMPDAGPLPPSADRATSSHRAHKTSDCGKWNKRMFLCSIITFSHDTGSRLNPDNHQEKNIINITNDYEVVKPLVAMGFNPW
ncbi:hypothetical protein [Algoriphagus aquimarinus]|uniref:Uncharacterized protein n=1 Tax=Algoriphagus aquimarinus TaxID=237018 RepID=A0A5C7AY46_9BACT|nr:hypothetical protein [Algoriphagus aquimarinus]TXE13726.1 hypothetical protein ESV85_07095 [Algoriphagus aquimarinus]